MSLPKKTKRDSIELVKFENTPEVISIEKKISAKKNFVIFKFIGLGCANVKNYKDHSEASLQEMCNPVNKVVSSIIKRKFIRDMKITQFVIDRAADVSQELAKGRHILLLGHSYGGSVAVRVAQLLSMHPYANRVHLATFGSIYIRKVANIVNQVHYVWIGDVVTKLLYLKEPKEPMWDPEHNVLWMKHPVIKPNSKIKRAVAFFGTENEWKLHGDYTWLIMDVMKKLDVHATHYFFKIALGGENKNKKSQSPRMLVSGSK